MNTLEATTGQTRPRVGVLLPDTDPAAWIVSAVEKLAECSDIVSLHHRRARRVPWKGILDPLDRRMITGPNAEAKRPVDLPVQASQDPWPTPDAVDIVFCLGVDIDGSLNVQQDNLPVPPSPRWGIWDLQLPADLGRGATIDGLGTETVCLRQIGGDRILRPSRVRVHTLSPAITRQRLLWRASHLPVRGLRDLIADDLPANEPDLPSLAVAQHRRPVRALRTALRRTLRKNGWYLGVQFEPPASPELHADDLHFVHPPGDRFWADPFPVVISDDIAHIYLEEWQDPVGRGQIAVLEVNRDGGFKHLGTCLETDGHLSHPHVFNWSGERFMIPETSSNRTVEVYRQQNGDPLQWELETVAMEQVHAVDVTVEQIGDRWWMWTNLGQPETSVHDELHIFYCDSPLGPWTPHPANPVVSDPGRARPAGGLFFWGQRLCRPAQDCSHRYGRALTIFEVTELTTSRFRERPLLRLEPGSFGANRLHTLNTDRWIRVIDLHRDRRRWP